MNIKSIIGNVPDFPKKGIMFRDITPLLASPAAFAWVVKEIAAKWVGKVDAVAALDARGFVFGAPVALALGVPLVLVRKKGKLPGETLCVTYKLEYGEDAVEMKADAVDSGMKVLVVDDLLATGGTAAAACALVETTGATVAGCAFVIELDGLGGKEKLAGHEVHALVTYGEKE